MWGPLFPPTPFPLGSRQLCSSTHSGQKRGVTLDSCRACLQFIINGILALPSNNKENTTPSYYTDCCCPALSGPRARLLLGLLQSIDTASRDSTYLQRVTPLFYSLLSNGSPTVSV